MRQAGGGGGGARTQAAVCWQGRRWRMCAQFEWNSACAGRCAGVEVQMGMGRLGEV